MTGTIGCRQFSGVLHIAPPLSGSDILFLTRAPVLMLQPTSGRVLLPKETLTWQLPYHTAPVPLPRLDMPAFFPRRLIKACISGVMG